MPTHTHSHFSKFAGGFDLLFRHVVDEVAVVGLDVLLAASPLDVVAVSGGKSGQESGEREE